MKVPQIFVESLLEELFCHPKDNQRILCIEHKRVHAIKFQGVVIPNCLVANMFGPIEGERHAIPMLALSDLLAQLQVHSYGQNGRALCFYGDPANPLNVRMNKNPTLARLFYFSDAYCLFFSRKMRELTFQNKAGLKLGGLLFGTGEYLMQIEDISFLSYDENLVMSKHN